MNHSAFKKIHNLSHSKLKEKSQNINKQDLILAITAKICHFKAR